MAGKRSRWISTLVVLALGSGCGSDGDGVEAGVYWETYNALESREWVFMSAGCTVIDDSATGGLSGSVPSPSQRFAYGSWAESGKYYFRLVAESEVAFELELDPAFALAGRERIDEVANAEGTPRMQFVHLGWTDCESPPTSSLRQGRRISSQVPASDLAGVPDRTGAL